MENGAGIGSPRTSRRLTRKRSTPDRPVHRSLGDRDSISVFQPCLHHHHHHQHRYHLRLQRSPVRVAVSHRDGRARGNSRFRGDRETVKRARNLSSGIIIDLVGRGIVSTSTVRAHGDQESNNVSQGREVDKRSPMVRIVAGSMKIPRAARARYIRRRCSRVIHVCTYR